MFHLEAPFPPAGDQPEAIRQLTLGVQDSKAHQVLLGVTGSGKTFNYIGYADNTSSDPWPSGAQPYPTQGPRAYQVERHYTEAGLQRGNPENDDSYMYLTLSAYKKFNNSSKSYRTINMHQKRKIKASF